MPSRSSHRRHRPGRPADTGPFSPDQRLWCLHCGRTFLASEAREEPYFGREGCAHCGAAGFGIDVFTEEDARLFTEAAPPSSGYVEGRDELLDIDARDEPGAVTHFEGLTIDRFAQLLAGGFIDPDSQQNDAPSAVECMVFLCYWPEVTLHGYALHPAREDGGGKALIEGFACALDDVDVARREPLRRAFQAHRRADGFIDDGATLYAWWD